MIKIEIKQSGQGYFKPENERIYDLIRHNHKKIKLFGITIWSRYDIIDDYEIVDIKLNTSKIGFDKNGNK